MRIFYAASSNATTTSQSRGWYLNFYMSLVDMGMDLVCLDYDFGPLERNADPQTPKQIAFVAKNRPRFGEELLRQVERAHRERPIDLFFSYFLSSYVEPQVIRQISSMGIQTVNWFSNASYQFHLIEEIAPTFDYCLSPEIHRLDYYRRVGANPIHCQMAANPRVYKPYPVAQDYDVTFVGQAYGDRTDHILHLLNSGIYVRVWGPGWRAPDPPRSLGKRLRRQLGRIKRTVLRQHVVQPVYPVPATQCGGPLSDEEMIKMYSRSKINLGFSKAGDTHLKETPIKQMRLRDFEVPMSGGFYMTEWWYELEDFLEPGKEIVCYRSKEDLVDKVKYYLAHDSEREKIRMAGYRRAVSDHTWQNRFTEVFRTIGLV